MADPSAELTSEARLALEPPAVPASAPNSGHTVARALREDGICLLTFDHPGSTANLLDLGTVAELAEHLTFIEHHPEIQGVVLASAKPSIFIAGADLHLLRGYNPPEQVRHLISEGQEVINRIAALPMPTVAAIHGAALGGGFEVCLACDYRVASSDRVSRIGLPETRIGLLPAWGGSTRLPRLLGLPKALKVILSGEAFTPSQALALGLIDEVVASQDLLDAAIRKLRAGKRRPSIHWLQNNPLAAAATAARYRRRLLRKTHGHYPAVLKALEVVSRGASRSPSASLALERQAVVELVQTDVCNNLIHLFFLEEQARKRTLPGILPRAEPGPIRHAAVIGAGVMGGGIAQWLSARQVEVVLHDIDVAQLARGMEQIARIYRESVAREALTQQEMHDGLARIRPANNQVPPGEVELVIEAAFEDLAVKKEIFRRLGEQTSPGTILATNTSALSVTEIASAARHPERVVGLHFFNPVHRMQLVEVIAARQTAPEVMQRSLRFVQKIGKLPALVKDSPGFIANRILTPYFNEALGLFEQGVAVSDLDGAMLAFGLPMGPMRLLDEIGLAVELRIAEALAARFGDRMRAPDSLRQRVEAGLLGRKCGRGYYLYEGCKHPRPDPPAAGFASGKAAHGFSREELQQRMLLMMINEAARCLEEQVVAQADEVDFVMVKGTGFAPFRGGPLRHADRIGAARLVGAMEHLADTGAPHFAPCDLLRSLAASSKKFYTGIGSGGEEPERKAA